MDITAVVMPVRAHWFGIPSPTMLFGVSLLVAAAAIALVVIGNWPAGLIVAAIAMLLLTAFLESARRRPTGRVAALVVKAARGAKARGRLGLDLLVAQAHAGRETSRIKLQLRRILRRRRRLLAVFGEAVYRGDDPADARAQLETLEARTYELERELRRLAVHTGERIRHARAAAGNGQMVAVPEPYPPPDEGDLPGPVITPEPLPPPDEGTPPRPDPVPTPGPEPTPAK